MSGATYWIVAAGCPKSKEDIQAKKTEYLRDLKSRVVDRGFSEQAFPPVRFEVPDGDEALKFGSFDNLIRLTDDLQKYDQQVEGIVRRFERQYLEIDPNADFKVTSQRNKFTFDMYIRSWKWDKAKFPKERGLSDNLALLLSVVNKFDEEGRNKAAQYNELKTQKGNVKIKDQVTLTTQDLMDVLTPKTVIKNGSPNDDFIETTHMTSIVVILPRGAEKEFLKEYANFSDDVVPMSARKFSGVQEDKDGNTIWRVVMFKTAVEVFKKACREHKYIVRDFTFSEDAHKQLIAQRERLDVECEKQLYVMKGFIQAAWSDTMVAWVHLKAMRVFVESVLRYGVPPHFASFILQPKRSQFVNTRKALADIFASQGFDSMTESQAAKDDNEEEYFPYVSLSFTPFAQRE